MQAPKRKLAAILSADVVGYSRLMGAAEEATLDTLKTYRAAIDRIVTRHGGRVVNAPGDSLLAEFPSAVEAVRAAVDIQHSVEGRNRELPEERQMHFRIGVNLGDVLVEDDGTLYGDGVNIAARMEALAEGGGICIASTVYDAVEGKIDAGFDLLGEHQVKNIAKPVKVYRVRAEARRAKPKPWRARPVPVVAAAALVVAIAVVGVWLYRDLTVRAPAEIAEVEDDPILAMPKGPAIAVLPFANLSGDPEQDYFADGITEEIITRLSRFQDLRVIARNSTMQYKGQAVDVRAVARDLGVRFVVEGSVRRAPDTIRVTAQLIDAEDGSHLWAETYDRAATVENLFAIQDDVTERVVAMIADSYGVISRRLAKESKTKPPKDWQAYDCTLLHFVYNITIDTHRAATKCLEQATAANPTYAEGWGYLAELYADDYAQGFDQVPGALDRALDAGLKAVEADPASQAAHWGLAYAYFQRRERELFIDEANKTLQLNPNRAYYIGQAGWALAYAGDWDRGVALVQKSFKLNPYGPTWFWFTIAANHYRLGEYQQALAAADKIKMPDFYWDPLFRSAFLAQLGRNQEAGAALAEALDLQPDIRQRVREYAGHFWFDPELIEHFLDGIRKAGLEIPPTN